MHTKYPSTLQNCLSSPKVLMCFWRAGLKADKSLFKSRNHFQTQHESFYLRVVHNDKQVQLDAKQRRSFTSCSSKSKVWHEAVNNPAAWREMAEQRRNFCTGSRAPNTRLTASVFAQSTIKSIPFSSALDECNQNFTLKKWKSNPFFF